MHTLSEFQQFSLSDISIFFMTTVNRKYHKNKSVQSYFYMIKESFFGIIYEW